MVELTEEKNYLIKKYYLVYYLNIIDANFKDSNKYKKDIEDRLDEKIRTYEKRDKNIRISSRVGLGCNYFIKKENMKMLSHKQLYELSKINPKYKNNLKVYYKNKNEFNINYYSTATQEEKNKQIEKVNNLIDNLIDNYNFEHDFKSFKNSMRNLNSKYNHYLYGLDIISKNKKIKEVDETQKFEDMLIEKCKKLSSKYLSEKELEQYERALFRYYINNNYLSNYTMYEKVESIKQKVENNLKNGDEILLYYYNKTNLGFDKIFDYFYNKYLYVCKDALLSINYYTPVKEYIIKDGIYTDLIINFIKKFPDSRFQGEKYFKNKIIGYVKEKEKYYDKEENVRKVFNEKYEKVVDAYIKSNVKKVPSSYIITRLGQTSKLLNKKTKKKKYEIYKSKITNIKESMMNAYIKYNNLLPSEEYDFKKYMDDVCENYIENGLYNNHEKHFIDAIDLYKKARL